MISTEDDAVPITQVNNHAPVSRTLQESRPPSQDIHDGFGSTEIGQPVSKHLGRPGTQFAFRVSRALTNGAKRLRIESEFQYVIPSAFASVPTSRGLYQTKCLRPQVRTGKQRYTVLMPVSLPGPLEYFLPRERSLWLSYHLWFACTRRSSTSAGRCPGWSWRGD